MSADARDPVLESRTRWRQVGARLQRVGYAALLAATVLFFIGLATGFDGIVATLLIATLIGGSIVLAVGIQVQYAIRGPERHEEDAAAQRRRA